MTKKFSIALGAATLLLVASSAFAAVFNHFPPGPTGLCTDTMSIVTLKTYLNTITTPCNAATPNTTGGVGDTVLGVGGIITGFDEIATGYDLYIQTTGGGPKTGLDVFTHGTNMRPVYGFNRGDSVIVEYACVANFYNDVELESPNNNFSGPNIVLRKVTTGNTLPPFFTGNSTYWKESTANTNWPPYVSALTTLSGPVRIARTVGLSFHGALAVSDAAPSDSVYIDYAKMTNIVPPAVGTILVSVSGIGNSATRGYRICPRDAADIIDTQPPGLSDAYSIDDTHYRIVFDRDVIPSSADSIANYQSNGIFAIITNAVMDGTNAVILTINPAGAVHHSLETVNVNNVRGSANGVAMTANPSLSFWYGAMTTDEVSAPNPDSLMGTPCYDQSAYSGGAGRYSNGPFGTRSTVTGVVTRVFGNLYYMQSATPGAPLVVAGNQRGVTIFAPPSALTPGHRYTVAGAAEMFYYEPEFAAIQYVKDNGSVGIPSPHVLDVATASYDTCDANQNLTDARNTICSLVQLQSVKVVRRFQTKATNGFHVVGPFGVYSDTMFIENQNNVLGLNDSNNVNYPALGTVVTVTGVGHYTTNTSTPSFRVCPGSVSDITQVLAVNPSPVKLSFSAYPNPARSVNLAFSLPKSSRVNLGVFDLLGRRVATLANGVMPAGNHTQIWNGTDANGNHVNSGVYFYRLNVDGQSLTGRTMLINN